MSEPELSDEQQRAVDVAKTNDLSIIVGPPGSGKTRLIAAIVALDPVQTLLLAPTGTAADRLTACTGRPAMVIEKALHDRDAKRLENRPVVIDEAGMVSITLLVRIFYFIKPRKLVLVGDPKQLPCVEGIPALHSLLEIPDIPRTVLLKRWRRDGKPPGALDMCLETLGTPMFNLELADDTFRIVVCNSVEECYTRAAKMYFERPSQMLAYTNPAVSRLNALTENPKAKIVHGRTRVGDRVVCLENAYVKDSDKLLVANGTCGTAREGSIKYDNGFVDTRFTKTRFMPCRAMTVNKSQGNEYDVHGIVVVAPWVGVPPLELMYTAVSRFKNSVTVFVQKRQLHEAFVGHGFRTQLETELIREFKLQ